MFNQTDSGSIKVLQDVDKAISVMQNAGKWLKESGKNPSKWWELQNLTPEFLLQYAKPEEFYVVMVNDKPAAAVILQLNQEAQDWQSIDKGKDQSAMYIHWLCVRREFAGKGLPKVVIDFASNMAKKHSIQLLRVDTNAAELKLRAIYEKLGFDLVSVINEDYRETALYQKEVT